MQLQLGGESQPSIGRLAAPAPPARVEKFEEEIRGLLGARITQALLRSEGNQGSQGNQGRAKGAKGELREPREAREPREPTVPKGA